MSRRCSSGRAVPVCDGKAFREVHEITADLCCECLEDTILLEPGDDIRGSETETSMEHKQEVDRKCVIEAGRVWKQNIGSFFSQ